MRPVRALLIYTGIVFLGGALLAPWLYWTVQSLTAHLPALQRLADNPFHRYVNRSLLALALVGLWPLLRGLGVRGWPDVGLVKPAGQWRKMAGGFAFGFASLACLAGAALAVGARGVNTDLSAGRLIGKVSSAALTAAVVAGAEGILFFGAEFCALRETIGLSHRPGSHH